MYSTLNVNTLNTCIGKRDLYGDSNLLKPIFSND